MWNLSFFLKFLPKLPEEPKSVKTTQRKYGSYIGFFRLHILRFCFAIVFLVCNQEKMSDNRVRSHVIWSVFSFFLSLLVIFMEVLASWSICCTFIFIHLSGFIYALDTPILHFSVSKLPRPNVSLTNITSSLFRSYLLSFSLRQI